LQTTTAPAKKHRNSNNSATASAVTLHDSIYKINLGQPTQKVLLLTVTYW